MAMHTDLQAAAGGFSSSGCSPFVMLRSTANGRSVGPRLKGVPASSALDAPVASASGSGCDEASILLLHALLSALSLSSFGAESAAGKAASLIAVAKHSKN